MSDTAKLRSLYLDGASLLCQLRELGEIGLDREIGGRTPIALTDNEKAGRAGGPLDARVGAGGPYRPYRQHFWRPSLEFR